MGDPKEGEIVEPGRVVAEIAVQKGFRFEAQVPMPMSARCERMPARVKLSAFEYDRYGTLPGTVCVVSPDSKGTDSTYTVRVELEGDEIGHGEFRRRVKLGMNGQAEFVVRRESAGVAREEGSPRHPPRLRRGVLGAGRPGVFPGGRRVGVRATAGRVQSVFTTSLRR